MRYRYVFWDWNGTLIDDAENALNCVNVILSKKGRAPITMEQYYTYIDTPISRFYEQILPPEELDFGAISACFQSEYKKRLPETKLADGAKEVLSALQQAGVKQYIISAAHKKEVDDNTRRYGIRDYFDVILGAEDHLASSKIDRAAQFLTEQGIDPREALLIGDSLHDYETANYLGMAGVLVSYGHQGKELTAASGALVIDSLSEVYTLVSDERRIDLHTHSTRSDGTMTPAKLVRHAKEKGFSAIALTDHDTVSGLHEARAEAEKIGLELVNGVEMSTYGQTEMHILGLFIDPDKPSFCSFLEKQQEIRTDRMKKTCAKLREQGFDITFEEAAQYTEKFVGRAHIARALCEKGYAEDIRTAFHKYLSRGCPAYIPKVLTAREAIEAIHGAGGFAFLAHLNQTGLSKDGICELLDELQGVGLDGIEGYYTEYTPKQTAFYRSEGAKRGLLFAGGSDFHAQMKPHIEIGVGTGGLCIPYHVLENLKRRRS